MQKVDSQVKRAICFGCWLQAGVLATIEDGRVTRLKGEPGHPVNQGWICERSKAFIEHLYHEDRLNYPLKRVGDRGEGKWQKVSWDDALDFIADKLKKIAAEHGWPAIAWVLGGPGAGTTKFGAYLRLASLTQSTRVSAWGYGDAGLPCGSRVIFGTQFPYALLFGDLLAGK